MKCKYCDQPWVGDPVAYAQNPYCAECLHERLTGSAEKNPLVRWVRQGKYAHPVREGDRLASRLNAIMSHPDASDRCPTFCDQAMRVVHALGLPEPYAYMSEDGGLTIEWTLPSGWEVSVDFGDDAIEGDATNTETAEGTCFELLSRSGSVPDEWLSLYVWALLRSAGWGDGGLVQ